MIDLKDFKTGLGEIRSRIGSSLEEERDRIESQRLLCWPFKSLCVGVGGCLRDQLDTDSAKPIFCIFFPAFPVQWYHQLHRQVSLEPG